MEYARLLWATRRGMLELDLLLGPYAREIYPSLPEEDQIHFQALLAQEDQSLFDWLMEKKPAPALFFDLIAAIRNYARDRKNE